MSYIHVYMFIHVHIEGKNPDDIHATVIYKKKIELILSLK